jgi:mono/diheme cytochrome c family protein
MARNLSLVSCILTWLFPFLALAQSDLALVARWEFESEETTKLRSIGTVHRDIPGPRSPLYPDFDATNTAIKLDGSGSHLEFDDPGTQSEFDFTSDEPISLEAWVQAESLRPGEFVYVLGKGRTTSSGATSENQNWALRIRERSQKGCVSFLFATPRKPNAKNADAHWHRWTSQVGFSPGRLWHHIAVSYRFGHPDSIRCWIDGKAVAGDWDMGGPTQEAPVVDNDAVWIGSSRGGSPGNSFRGSLDSIAIHRRLFDDVEMAQRYRTTDVETPVRLAPEVMPELEVPSEGVLLTLHAGMPSHTRWLNEGESIPPATMEIPMESILLDRLAQSFDSWGIRSAWTEPVLVRFASDVVMPTGPQALMMRVRGLSRLWCNGDLVARADPIKGSPSGEEPMTPVTASPFPSTRMAEHRQQQIQVNIEVPSDGKVRLVLETIVGGKGFRTDPGETCLGWIDAQAQEVKLVAWGDSKRWIRYDDQHAIAQLDRTERLLERLDTKRRRELASSQDAYWDARHAMAKRWVQEHPVEVPKSSSSQDVHPIDAFLEEKIHEALRLDKQIQSRLDPAQQASARWLGDSILPLLASKCGRCHVENRQGGLGLDDIESMLAGGDSGQPAIVPGNPAQSLLIQRVLADSSEERMPPGDQGLNPEEIESLETWISQGATWIREPLEEDQVRYSPKLDDAKFLRKLTYDLIGLPPTQKELEEFLADPGQDKRLRAIDRLLLDDRHADASMGYWQDVLAENPTLINSSLNTTGPFRWFLYDAFRDNKPVDRWVTELILMRGSPHEGGSAGFGIAGDNDAPQAAKAQILASAFLGIQTQCARCHDSPYHMSTQDDLYSIASMLEQKPLTVPKSSRVPSAFFENKTREALIKVTLDVDKPVQPKWPWPELLEGLPDAPEATRERLAMYVTSPQNQRFARVYVNRIWRRLMGAGIVEPVGDWEGAKPSHRGLLDWLANEFMKSRYDSRRLVRTIVTSQAYGREALGSNRKSSATRRFFAAPDPRRLEAEQIVDALAYCSGRSLDVEELTFDPDARRPASNRLTLGIPTRAWMFANLANERDRPSLNLPRAQLIGDLLLVFGWNGARQNPRTDRETQANALQPGMMSNSLATQHFIRAVGGGALSALAREAKTPEDLVRRLYQRYLSRMPSTHELEFFSEVLSEGFEQRILASVSYDKPSVQESFAIPESTGSFPKVTWSNHLRPEANQIAMELERLARRGPAVDPWIEKQWRERLEDMVWCMINTDEFIWLP